jgi:uncharacterized glyoxalase superfamily protein PhnB
MSKVKPIPDGFHTITPTMIIKDANKAIKFYEKAFGAELILRMAGPNDSVMHAEIKIGDSIIMMGEEWPGHHVQSPATIKGTTGTLNIYVNDVDTAHKKAVEAGAKEIMAPADMFWGDRFSAIMDPFGHSWSLAIHIMDMTPEECQKAADEWMASMAKGGGADCK